jgi:hypothetical protein
LGGYGCGCSGRFFCEIWPAGLERGGGAMSPDNLRMLTDAVHFVCYAVPVYFLLYAAWLTIEDKHD